MKIIMTESKEKLMNAWQKANDEIFQRHLLRGPILAIDLTMEEDPQPSKIRVPYVSGEIIDLTESDPVPVEVNNIPFSSVAVKRPVMPHINEKLTHGSRKKLVVELEYFGDPVENEDKEALEKEEEVKGLLETFESSSEMKDPFNYHSNVPFFDATEWPYLLPDDYDN